MNQLFIYSSEVYAEFTVTSKDAVWSSNSQIYASTQDSYLQNEFHSTERTLDQSAFSTYDEPLYEDLGSPTTSPQDSKRDLPEQNEAQLIDTHAYVIPIFLTTAASTVPQKRMNVLQPSKNKRYPSKESLGRQLEGINPGRSPTY